MQRSLVGLAASPPPAGCAMPSTQIATGLERYCLDSGRAACVGDALQPNLSLGQLRQLGRAAAASRNGDTDPTRPTTAGLLRVAGEIGDPQVALELGKAAAGCDVLP